jgi:Tfp pilus assembly protein PilP
VKPREIGIGLVLVGSFALPAAALLPAAELPAFPADPPAALDTADAAQKPPAAEKDDGDQRDPFRPFTLDLRPREPQEPLTPLQTYELRQLTVAAVLWDLSPPLAMLEDELGMGFIVSPGTLIGRNHGTVMAIEPGRVIVEEKMIDFYGHEQVNRVVLEIPREGEPRSGARETR